MDKKRREAAWWIKPEIPVPVRLRQEESCEVQVRMNYREVPCVYKQIYKRHERRGENVMTLPNGRSNGARIPNWKPPEMEEYIKQGFHGDEIERQEMAYRESNSCNTD